MRTGVITIVAGRQAHLAAQRRALAAADPPPHRHVVVVMDQGTEQQTVPTNPGLATTVARLPIPAEGLPLAAARNLGARRALAGGAELLVFLDVDCIPAPALLNCYHDAAVTHPRALLAGPVAYLPPPPDGGYPVEHSALAGLARPHPARPVPPDGTVVAEDRTELFWSLSFATTAATWRRIGGFHPGYLGYGGEDTDFALVAHAAGAALHWVGGAHAYHQDHGPSGPSPANTSSIVRNAHLFRVRHGWWPMRGWLHQLHAAAAVRFDPDADVLEVIR